MENKKYWHELPQSEVDQLYADNKTVQHAIDNYLQPDWCRYPEALNPMLGCWSLTGNEPGGLRTKISEKWCSDCDCFKKILPC